NDGRSVLDASLLDISETGARIRLMTPAVLPDEFDLHLADGRRPRVEIVWRNAATLGVAFVRAASPPASPDGQEAAPALLDRIAAIEEQLAELRRQMAAQLRG